jgi:hypothetical protein
MPMTINTNVSSLNAQRNLTSSQASLAVSMQRLLRFDRSQAERAAVTAKINSLFSESIASYGANSGWEGMTYPERRYLIVNVPTAVRYLPRSAGGTSHFRPVRDNVAITWMHTRLTFISVLRRLGLVRVRRLTA